MEHPLAAIAIGAFFLLQIGAFTRLIVTLKRCRRELTETMQVPIQVALAGLRRKEVDWAMWSLPQDTTLEAHQKPGQREEFLYGFEQWLASRSSYLLLQRISVMAPLLGVIITAVGFLNMRGSLQDDSEYLLGALIPLVIGVGGGASLAFVNQVLLQIVDRTLDSLRSVARHWFEVRSTLDGEPDPSLSDGDGKQPSAVQLMEDIASQNVLMTNLLQGVISQQTKTESVYKKTLDQWLSSINQSPNQLATITDTMAETSQSIANLLPLVTKMTSAFDASVQRFQDSVTHGLQPILTQHSQSSLSLSEIARTCLDALQRFDKASQGLEEIVKKQNEVTVGYLDTMEKCLIPQQQELGSYAGRIENATKAMATPIEQFLSTMQEFVAGFSDGMQGLNSIQLAADAFSQGIQQDFLPAAALHRQILSSIQTVSHDTGEATKELKESISHFGEAAEASKVASNQLLHSIETNAVPAHSLLAKSIKQFEGSTESLTEHADRFRAAMQAHSNGVGALEQKVAQTIENISQTTHSLNATIKETLTQSFAATNLLVEQIAGLTENLETSAVQLNDWSQTSALLNDSQVETSDSLNQVLQSVKQLVGRLDNVLVDDVLDTQSRISTRMVSAQDGVLEAVTKLNSSSDNLAAFLQSGIVPLTDRIFGLEKSLEHLQEVMNNIGALAEASRNADSFLEALKGVAQLTRTIDALPKEFMKEMKVILAHSEETQHEEKQKSGWKFWSKS